MRARPSTGPTSPDRFGRSLVRAALAIGLLAVSPLALDACTNVLTNPPAPIAIGPGVTSVSVDPASFLGSVVCSDQPGGMRSYVATITDVRHPCSTGAQCRSGTCALGICVDTSRSCATDDDCFPGQCAPSFCSNKPGTACQSLTDCACTATDPSDCKPGICLSPVCTEAFTFPSSPPTSCAQSTYFEYVTVGAAVVAEVDGYEEPADQLVAVCGLSGPQAPCQTDLECPLAYGCHGQCLINIYYDPNADDTGQSKLNTPCADSPEPMPGSVDGGPSPAKACACSYLQTEGDRHLVSRATQQPVTPRWTTPASDPCGAGPNPPVAQAFVNVSIEPCSAFGSADGGVPEGGADGGPLTGTVRVIPFAALPSSLACQSTGGTGTVTAFDVIPADKSLMSYTGLTCGPAAQVSYPGLTPSKSYAFTLQAYEGGSKPTQTASCFATPIASVTVSAMCDPLVPVP